MNYSSLSSNKEELFPTIVTSTSEPAEQDNKSNASSTTSAHKLGLVSATFLVFNRMVGTGIFATPSTILAMSGSVGTALLMWLAGILIAAAGLLVYMEWGCAIPKNGGEKNYLEYYFTKPKFLMSSMYAAYSFLLGFAASNSVVFGEYLLVAVGVEPDRWNQRIIGLACITATFLMNSFSVKWGLVVQDILGASKLLVIMAIVVCGWIALAGKFNISNTHAFDHPFMATVSPSGYGISMALYNVIWSFLGYSNVNYALAETKDPVRALKISAPIALAAVSLLYLLANVAYFAVIPTEEMKTSGRILAAYFFKIIFGPQTERVVSAFVALSALGNVMSIVFAQGRLIQEFGKENILPWSRFFASNRPFNTPMAGMFQHWFVSAIIMLAPPPGDAYNFIVNLISYPLSFVNAAIAIALIMINLQPEKYPDWAPPIRATIPITGFFLLSSLFLMFAPFIPPPEASQNVYVALPYWLHCCGILFFLVGAVYWYAMRHWFAPAVVDLDNDLNEPSFGPDGLELFEVPLDN